MGTTDTVVVFFGGGGGGGGAGGLHTIGPEGQLWCAATAGSSHGPQRLPFSHPHHCEGCGPHQTRYGAPSRTPRGLRGAMTCAPPTWQSSKRHPLEAHVLCAGAWQCPALAQDGLNGSGTVQCPLCRGRRGFRGTALSSEAVS